LGQQIGIGLILVALHLTIIIHIKKTDTLFALGSGMVMETIGQLMLAMAIDTMLKLAILIVAMAMNPWVQFM